MNAKPRRRKPRAVVSNGQRLMFTLFLMDNSTSITVNLNALLEGQRAMLEGMQTAPEGIRMRTMLFHNEKRKKNYVPIAKVKPLTRPQYPLFGGTPLYPSMYEGLTDLMRVVKSWRSRAYTVTTSTILFADGQNNCSSHIGAEDVRQLVEPMLASGEHIIEARGVHFAGIDFHRVFGAMGIKRIEVLQGGAEIMANMMSTGGGLATASSTVEGFAAATMQGLTGVATDQAQ